MKSTILGIYETNTQAFEAAELLRNRGFSSEYIPSLEETDSTIHEQEIGPTGIFLGGIIGIVAGYIIFLTTGINALTISNGLGPFLWTIVIVGVIGAISGGFLGSFVSFGLSQDMSIYNAYLNQGSSIVAITGDEKDERKIYTLLQRTGARKIQIVPNEPQERIVPGYLPLAYVGIKGGHAKQTKKKASKKSPSRLKSKTL